MSPQHRLALSRRSLLCSAGAAAIGLNLRGSALWSRTPGEPREPDTDYLTAADQFGTIERGNPLPYTLPPERLREVGLDRETWQLEVVPDAESNTKLEHPMSKERGTALDWSGLMRLAETHAVRYLKVMTCNNVNEPLGIGLWEGVPLREVIWLTRPVENLRRVFYYGYHNDDPAQRFQSSLAIGRVLEDPPGERPVMLCYKLNGEWLSGKRGGPVRMLVPEAYGFKSVKWLQRVELTNNHQANDTYAAGNNDIESPMKTFARFLRAPETARPGEPIALGGQAQVGLSGLSKVQVWVHPSNAEWPADDPYFAKAAWRDASIMPAPDLWGSSLPGGRLPMPTLGFDSATSKPLGWPMRYTLAHWSAKLEGLEAGKYLVSCRAIDGNGLAQPMPRPFAKSGRNAIQRVTLIVDGTR
jgi:DMSO/TMAO reductase YedYZ molybdopterin-dependent catalytic subunit